MKMKEILKEERFNIITEKDKEFITAFDKEMQDFGYDFGGKIGDGICWGKYMIIYLKTGVKAKKNITRIYIRENHIVLRLYFSKIDEHRDFIEKSPSYIKDVFTGDAGKCNHCHNEKDGQCKFRKTYTIDNNMIEKCNGMVFEFLEPSIEYLSDYMDIIKEFYTSKKKR